MVEFKGWQEEPLQKTLDVSLLRRLWPFVRPYRASFALTLLTLVVLFVIEIAGTFLLRLVFDGPVTDAALGRPVATGQIWLYGSLYLGYVLLFAGLGYAYTMLTAWNGQRVIRDVRARLYAHVLALAPRFFEKNPAGKLVTRVTSDVENLNELISTGVLQTLFDVVKIVGILAFLFWLDVRLALFTLLTTPIVILISLWFRKYARESYRKVRSRLARQNAFTSEAIGGMRTTRV